MFFVYTPTFIIEPKKVVLSFVALLMLMVSVVGFTACGESNGGSKTEEKETHTHTYTESVVDPTCTEQGYTLHKCSCGEEYKDNYVNALNHSFDRQDTNSKYIKSSATCTQKAIYYYSCSRCGEKGTETFEYGELGEHNYGEATYEWSADYSTCTATRVCQYDNTHIETEIVNTANEITQQKDCVLDELTTFTAAFTNEAFSTQTKEVKTAERKGHTFDQQNTDSMYLKSEATCTQRAVYYYSCECGEIGTDTFEYGELGEHKYGEVTYEWSADYSTCTATRVCQCDSKHIETETVNSTSKITQQKDCVLDELTTFTAIFTNEAFSTQTKEVKTAEKKGHNFDQQNTDSKYIKSEATCTSKAVYYYSCSRCGAVGTDTFEYGELLEHIYNKQNTNSKYLKSGATCTQKAVYYYSCECGKIGTDTFEYGELLEHTYSEQNTDSRYLKSGATCTQRAVYYYSCECGEIGTDTFEYGEVLEHTYNKQNTDSMYLKSEATCTQKAVYYYSCECGAVGTDTFEYGELLEHNYVDRVCSVCGKKQPSEGLAYTLINNDTEYEVSGIGTCTDIDIVIPNTYNGKPVTSIGDYAFIDYPSLTSIEIPDRVTSIGSNAFYNCSSLKKVNYTGTIDSWCEIVFGNYRANLLEYALYKYALYINNELVTEVEITTATKINAYAFFCCSSLTSVEIGDSVTSIGNCSFNSCSSLTSVEIGNNVTSIGEFAFEYCSSLTGVVIGDSVNNSWGIY